MRGLLRRGGPEVQAPPAPTTPATPVVMQHRSIPRPVVSAGPGYRSAVIGKLDYTSYMKVGREAGGQAGAEQQGDVRQQARAVRPQQQTPGNAAAAWRLRSARR